MKTRKRILQIRERNCLDKFVVHFFSGEDPLASGDGGVEGILDAAERLGELAPDRMHIEPHRERRYSRAVALKQFATRTITVGVSDMWLLKDDDDARLWMYLWLRFLPHPQRHFEFHLEVTPFDFYRDQALGEARSQQILAFVLEMARLLPPSYAWGHSSTDATMGGTTGFENSVPEKVDEVYWLNIYGRQRVEALGRERVLATPAAHLEELPHGGVLFLTRPTPGDYASDEARIAQARAIAHLNPELSFESALARQRARSAHIAPVERNWDPDLVDLLNLILEGQASMDRPRETARLNAWRPPPVSEWMPLAEAPPGEGEGFQRGLLSFVDVNSEVLQLMTEDTVPEVKQADPASLMPLDEHFWRHNGAARETPEDIEKAFIPAVGSYLGELLVHHLGGRWVGRRRRDECYVALGDRAWFPFLRARHYLGSRQSVLDYSLTKFYLEAERYVRAREGQTGS